MFRMSQKTYYNSESFADFRRLQSDLSSDPKDKCLVLGKESRIEKNKSEILLYCAKKAPNKTFRKTKYLSRVKSGYKGAANVLATARRNLALSDSNHEMVSEAASGPWEVTNKLFDVFNLKGSLDSVEKPLTSRSLSLAIGMIEQAVQEERFAKAKENAEAEQKAQSLQAREDNLPLHSALFKRDATELRSPESRDRVPESISIKSKSFYFIKKDRKFWVRRRVLRKKKPVAFDKEFLGKLGAGQANIHKVQERSIVDGSRKFDVAESSASFSRSILRRNLVADSDPSLDLAPVNAVQTGQACAASDRRDNAA